MEFETDLSAYKKVISLARTPGMEELKRVGGITLIAILIVGSLGFGIYTIMSFLPV